MQPELMGPPENKPMEVAKPITTLSLVQDSSFHMVMTVEDPEGGNLREHNHLGQYLVRQQVYDKEFRDQPDRSLGCE